jgi:M6 family metalloprotease-like protein
VIVTTARRSVALVLGAAALAAGDVGAQDVEIAAQVAGRELPAGYYERVQRSPDFFRPQGGWIARAALAGVIGQPVTGDLPLVAIPALFVDSPDPQFSVSDLSAVLFEGPGAEGTLREYYAEVSGGRLNIAGAVGPWARTSLTLAEVVAGSWGLGGDARVGEFLVEALTIADANTDFGLFDNDGPDNIPNSGDDDGVVDAVAFYFLEIAASCGGPGIWPHFSSIENWVGQPFEANDQRPDGTPIKINPYFIQSIVNCAGTEIGPIAVIAHELGHLLGLPDLYHPVDGLLPEQRRWVVGCWSLMAAGAWGCGEVGTGVLKRPTHMGAWEKKQLGWLDDILLVPDNELTWVTLMPVQTSRRILEIPLGESERLLIEYRERSGFDLDLPAAGVLIYRINDTIPFRPCSECPPLYRVGLLEADGDSALVKTHPQGGNRGEAGDAYGALGPGALTILTNPSTHLDAGLGGESSVNIYQISLADGTAQLVFSTTAISLARLLAPLLLDDGHQLTDLERQFLDEQNNRNGRYDVGDLRAYLQRSAAE